MKRVSSYSIGLNLTELKVDFERHPHLSTIKGIEEEFCSWLIDLGYHVEIEVKENENWKKLQQFVGVDDEI